MNNVILHYINSPQKLTELNLEYARNRVDDLSKAYEALQQENNQLKADKARLTGLLEKYEGGITHPKILDIVSARIADQFSGDAA